MVDAHDRINRSLQLALGCGSGRGDEASLMAATWCSWSTFPLCVGGAHARAVLVRYLPAQVASAHRRLDCRRADEWAARQQLVCANRWLAALLTTVCIARSRWQRSRH